jgi:very-short-patch-repair endonuclease
MDLAARQHGLVTVGQALDSGLSHEQVKHRREAGALRSLRRGVLAVVGTPSSWEQAVMAAVLAAGEGAVASHLTAALLWGFPDVLRDVGIEVTTDRSDQRRMRGVRTHRTVKFLSCEHTTQRGIPVTTVARTLVDCSVLLSFGQLARAMDDGLRRGTTTLRAIRTCVSGLRPAPGRRPSVIQGLLAKRLPGYEPGDVDSEVRLMRLLVDAGLLEPVLQHRVVVDGDPYKIDLAYPHVKLAIEYDGFEFHNTRTAFDRDRERANRLTAIGWTFLRITSEMSDGAVVNVVRKTLTALVQNSRI